MVAGGTRKARAISCGGQVARFHAGVSGHLGVSRQRRVAAGEDQAQAVVFHVFVVPIGRCQRIGLRLQ